MSYCRLVTGYVETLAGTFACGDTGEPGDPGDPGDVGESPPENLAGELVLVRVIGELR